MGDSIRKSRFSFQLRFLTLVFLAFTPIFALTTVSFTYQRNVSKLEAQNSITRLANVKKLTNAQLILSAKELLIALSMLPEIQGPDTERCTELLSELTKTYNKYVNLGVADLKGNVICSGIRLEEPVNVSDRKYFQEAVETREFSIGEYQIGKITGIPGINFGYPVLNDNRELKSVVYASVGTEWINDLIESIILPESFSIIVFDRRGKILARHPDSETWVGKDISEAALFKNVVQNGASFETKGVDDVPRLYTSYSIGEKEEQPDAYIAIGFDKTAVFAPANKLFLYNLLSLSVLMLVCLYLAWRFSNNLVLREIRQLERLDKLKTEFISTASHELRTPLAAIRSNSFLIKKYFSDQLANNKDLKEMADDIYASSIRLINLVKELLDVARLEMKKINFKIQRVNIAKLAEEVVGEYESLVKDKEVSLEFTNTLNKKVFVSADEDKIKQVMVNILGNAIKFTPKGRIEIKLTKEGEKAKIWLKDTGVGISKNDRKNLFGKFQKIPTNSAILNGNGGAGLGLYISRLLIEGMGGTIKLEESKPGKGSTFSFSLPIYYTK